MFRTEADRCRADWPLLQNGAVNLFWNPAILNDAKRALIDLDYEILTVSCGLQNPSFEVQMSRALKWSEQFGYEPWTGNLDALDEAVRFYPIGRSNRVALAIEGFHHLVAADDQCTHHILDIIETAARYHLLESRLLIGLVQTDDPNFSYSDIGGRGTNWNHREWLNASRSL